MSGRPWTKKPEAAEPAGRRSAFVIRTQATIGTLLILLAINGVLPLLGHTPVGPWSPAAEASFSAPTQTPAPAQAPAKKAAEAAPGK
jgi:hypothetical protein